VTTVRTVAVHDVVAAAFPREVRDDDRVAMAKGKAIDAALSQLSHEARIGRRTTAASVEATALRELDDALAEGAVEIPPAERAETVEEVRGVTRAFRASVLFGLARPRSHLLLIGPDAGVYAQPDYWNGRDRIYEMKSYRAIPPKPEVALQLRLFQLAFPGCAAFLVCIDRHARPVATTTAAIAPPSEADARAALGLARSVALASGRPRQLEYVDAPIVRVAAPAEK
jgi:hypothetical protein